MGPRDTRKILICFVLLNFISIILCDCDFDEHYCAYTAKCIDSEYLCDGDNDCGDNSDETEEQCSRNIFHATIPAPTEGPDGCPNTHVECSEATGSKCIHRSWVCDGEWDCLQGSDERHCLHPSPRTTPEVINSVITMTDEPILLRPRNPLVRIMTIPPPGEQSCSHDQFRCPEKCINKNWVCDFDPDCSDGSDENPQICEGSTTAAITEAYELFSFTTQSSSTPRVTSVTADDSSTHGNLQSNKSSEECDVQTGSSPITFTLWNWLQCGLLALGIICLIAIVLFVCKKRKRRSAGLTSRNVENRLQAVSFLNSNIAPECQLVLVGTPVQVQPPTVVRTASAIDQPPPYDTQPSSHLTQPSTKTEKCLL